MEYPLNVETPRSFSLVKRNIPRVTLEQRERALRFTHYNEFAFPAGMLTVDMLSDSGTTAMTDLHSLGYNGCWSVELPTQRPTELGVWVALMRDTLACWQAEA